MLHCIIKGASNFMLCIGVLEKGSILVAFVYMSAYYMLFISEVVY